MASCDIFDLETLNDLQIALDRLGLELPLSQDLSCLQEAVAFGKRRSPNRFAVHPMEGFDAELDGTPGELAFRRYRRYAAGGAGLIWFEACAVWDEARSNPRQLWLHKANIDTFARLAEATRAEAKTVCNQEPVLILQVTHSGRYSKPGGVPHPRILHHSPILDPRHNLPADYPLVTDDELDRLGDAFVDIAKLAALAGFDGVDVKACHRYLISELLASHTRSGKYGGSYENRTRLLRETLARIKGEVPQIFITTRLNVYDAIAYPYGWGVDRNDAGTADLAEPKRLVKELADLGVSLLSVSIGNPYFNPHYGRPYEKPLIGVTKPEEHPLKAVARFVEITRAIQQTVPEIPVIGGGYAWLRHLLPPVAAGIIRTGGATLIGQGRGAFAYPDSVRDILTRGQMDPKKVCVTCSACSQMMRDGAKSGCVVRDAAIYAAEYRRGRQQAS